MMDEEDTISVSVAFEIKRRNAGGSITITPTKKATNQRTENNYDYTMIKSFAEAYSWKLMVEQGCTMKDISRTQGVHDKYISRVYRLNLVSPQIVKAIVDGKQPKILRLQDFMTKDIPLLWEEQEKLYGFKE